MRILILVDCYYPSTKSSAKLVHDLAVELMRRGNQAVVLTPSDTIAGKLEERTEDGVTVARVKTGPIKGVNRIIRAANEMRLSARIWRSAKTFLRQNPCDLIVFYSPTIFFGRIGTQTEGFVELSSLSDSARYFSLLGGGGGSAPEGADFSLFSQGGGAAVPNRGCDRSAVAG